jgi:hypothetical protein
MKTDTIISSTQRLAMFSFACPCPCSRLLVVCGKNEGALLHRQILGRPWWKLTHWLGTGDRRGWLIKDLLFSFCFLIDRSNSFSALALFCQYDFLILQGDSAPCWDHNLLDPHESSSFVSRIDFWSQNLAVQRKFEQWTSNCFCCAPLRHYGRTSARRRQNFYCLAGLEGTYVLAAQSP